MVQKKNAPKPPKSPKDQYLFGIGEWFGKSFPLMTPAQRRYLAEQQLLPKKLRHTQICPFQSRPGHEVECRKEFGVCTIRVYRKDGPTGTVAVAQGSLGIPRTVCPKRFEQNGTIFEWIGETILKHPKPMIVQEVNFLQRLIVGVEGEEGDPEFQDIGRIDHILIHPTHRPLDWCALEIQAVYFSGKKMSDDFRTFSEHTAETIPFPTRYRRPDDRSSGPKRLMPQLQTKVPSLRRWGKKMAVIIDEGFFNALGKMETVKHVSNCDIAWFVVTFDESGGEAVLKKGAVQSDDTGTFGGRVDRRRSGQPGSV
jgi:Restriction endonuclease NotI